MMKVLLIMAMGSPFSDAALPVPPHWMVTAGMNGPRRSNDAAPRCGSVFPHDVDSTVMLSSATVSFLSKGLIANHFT